MEDLRTNAKYSSPSKQYLIRRSIVRLWSKGMKVKDVAVELDVSLDHVYKTKRSYAAKGIDGIKPQVWGRKLGEGWRLSNMNNKPTVFTIGHSTHEAGEFLEILRYFEINCVVDVRSVPFSSFTPQFNQNTLKTFLKTNGVEYLHFDQEFGAQQTAKDLLDAQGIVDFEKVRQSATFKHGIDRLNNGIEKGFRIAIMCSEDDPLKCHRFSMIAVGLEDMGFEVLHILKDMSIKTNEDLKKDLITTRKKYNSNTEQLSLFPDLVTEIALKNKNKKIGYAAI